MKSQMPKFRFRDPEANKQNRKQNFRKIIEKRKKQKKFTDEDEIEIIRKRLWPDFGDDKQELQPSDIEKFTDLPLSKKTLQGLDAMKFCKPTDIQKQSLLYALKGNDILGAAKTGSGKTLAFLIPILETLFRQRFTPSFGMAAIVISPTRELAYQSFDVLRKMGRFHSLSFGLAIGGMFLREEAKKMHTTNVVICTPGRLLQHFEQTPNFTADEVKVLVLDEADKILDLGFAETLNSIVEALPRQRQTLLFSATQTKSIKSLARLSLKKPIYVSVHEKAKEVTPTQLNQRYIVCDQQNKVNMLWSFIKSHKLKKMLVFLSSCKQVRYLFQAFKKMHPGLTILCLHGHMKQLQRMEAYELFSRKRNAVLLATDVAARGLDFPSVHWVIQVDKPENVDTYIHRVGRTARYEQNGEALLMLMPSEEEKMVEGLSKRKIPIVKLKVSKKRMFDVTKRLESFCASDHELKNNAQKGFISVMKTLYILDKETFSQVDTDAYAASLGLVQAPKLPFLAKPKMSKEKKKADEGEESGEESSDGDQSALVKKSLVPAGRKKTLDFTLGDEDDDDDDDADDDDDKDDGIYNVVRASTAHIEDEESIKEELNLIEEGTKASKKKTTYKQKLRMLRQSKLITFDEEGNAEGEEPDEDGEQGLDIAKAKERLRQQDKIDKQVQRQRIKMEHREKRLKEKQKRREEAQARMGISVEEDGPVAVLGSPEDGDGGSDDDGGASGSGGDYESEEEDEGPQVKRRKMDVEEGSDDDDDDDADDDDDDDEASGDDDGDANMDEDDNNNEDSEDDDENEAEESEEDDEGRPEEVEQDEAAVLALLGGSR